MFHKIARTVKTFSFMLLSWQGKFLEKRLVKRLGYDGKKIVKGCTLDLKKEEIENSEKVDKEVALILKNCRNNAEALIKVFEAHNTPVYQIKNSEKVLKKIHEREGLITERTGLNALLINLVTTKTFSLKSPTMIVVEAGELDVYELMHALHKWVALKNGLAGLDEKSQKLLRRFDSEKDDNIIGRLSLTDIDKVRSAIARDVQSINFVVKYSKEHAGAKKALEKMKNEGGANI
mgnify:FL=1